MLSTAYRHGIVTALILFPGLLSRPLPAELIKETTLSGKVRTVYYAIEKANCVQPNTLTRRAASHSGAWTGSLAINACSGYYRNHIGLDASLYSVTRLAMADKNRDSKQLLNASNEGFSKLGQACMKLQWGHDDNQRNAHTRLKAGRQIINNGLITSSSARSVPTSWQGYSLNPRINRWRLGLVYVDRISLRDQAGFHTLENYDGRRIEYIGGCQIQTRINNLDFCYRNGYARNFLHAHNARISGHIYPSADSELILEARYYLTRKAGSLWTGYTGPVPVGAPGNSRHGAFDRQAEHYSLSARLIRYSYNLVAAISQTRAPLASGHPGCYYHDFGRNTHGAFDSPTAAFSEQFIHDGETAWKIGGEYDFSSIGLSGLRMGYFYHYGQGMKAHRRQLAPEQEHNLMLSWQFSRYGLKGLELKIKFGHYTNGDSLRNTMGYGRRVDFRSWLDYTVAFF